jgi:hypothetical protein
VGIPVLRLWGRGASLEKKEVGLVVMGETSFTGPISMIVVVVVFEGMGIVC